MFICDTVEAEFDTATITVTINGIASTDSFVASDVFYNQTSWLRVDTIDSTATGNTVTFTGGDFPISDYTAYAMIGGIAADFVTITNST